VKTLKFIVPTSLQRSYLMIVWLVLEKLRSINQVIIFGLTFDVIKCAFKCRGSFGKTRFRVATD
jgi:hypothetical protein